MSAKPETTFIKGVHRHIPTVYAEKTNNPFRSGTADVWYSGILGDLWIEYKFLPRIPKSTSILPGLTPRQRKWLNSRFDEGRNVAVVLGTPDGGVIYRDKTWSNPMSQEELLKLLLSKEDIARWIYSEVGASSAFHSVDGVDI